jgi:hypothetical protein
LPLHRPALAIPLHPDGRPHFEGRAIGTALDASTADVALEFHFLTQPLYGDLVLGIEGPDTGMHWAGVRVVRVSATPPNVTRVLCRFGGCGHDLLRPQSLTAHFDPATLRYTLSYPEEVLDAWAHIGVLRYQPRGLAATCPACDSIPAFRPGCPSCGSSLLTKAGLVQHVPCGHAMQRDDWQGRRFLYCPSCERYGLASAGEFDCRAGSYCGACGWVGVERVLFGHCRTCWNYFPAELAVPQAIPSYEVCRFDPATVPAPVAAAPASC